MMTLVVAVQSKSAGIRKTAMTRTTRNERYCYTHSQDEKLSYDRIINHYDRKKKYYHLLEIVQEW